MTVPVVSAQGPGLRLSLVLLGREEPQTQDPAERTATLKESEAVHSRPVYADLLTEETQVQPTPVGAVPQVLKIHEPLDCCQINRPVKHAAGPLRARRLEDRALPDCYHHCR